MKALAPWVACLLLLGLAGCRVQPSREPPAAANQGPALTVEEHAVASARSHRPDRLEYLDLIPGEVRARRSAWRDHSAAARLERANRALAPFGYRLVQHSDTRAQVWDLYRSDQVAAAGLTFFGPVAVSDTGEDFAMLAEAGPARTVLVRSGGVKEWGPEELMRRELVAPVVLGRDLVEVTREDGAGEYAVWRGGRKVYAFTALAEAAPPVRRLTAWDGHWVLEVEGRVIIDGASLNRREGYDEVFEWRLVRGQPFYFLKKDGRIGVSYAGQVLPQQYDEVIHYMCCEPAMFNVAGNDSMVWFHARRGETWYYVEMGAYD